MGVDVPLGTEIAAALLVALASVLLIVAKRIVGAGDNQNAHMPSDQMRVDFRPVLERIEAREGEMQREIAALVQQLAQHDRHIAQLVDSLSRSVGQMFHERERVEHAREVKALEDEIDRLRRGKG